jgi:hypothetical protein
MLPGRSRTPGERRCSKRSRMSHLRSRKPHTGLDRVRSEPTAFGTALGTPPTGRWSSDGQNRRGTAKPPSASCAKGDLNPELLGLRRAISLSPRTNTTWRSRTTPRAPALSVMRRRGPPSRTRSAAWRLGSRGGLPESPVTYSPPTDELICQVTAPQDPHKDHSYREQVMADNIAPA